MIQNTKDTFSNLKNINQKGGSKIMLILLLFLIVGAVAAYFLIIKPKLDDNKDESVDNTDIELNNYPTNVEALCGKNSGKGNKQTTMKWIGENCGDNKIKWNSMSTVSNLSCGKTEDNCRWKRADYINDSNWINTYVGSCGIAPSAMPNLPMTVDKVEEHNNSLVKKCWTRMPTGCKKNLSETNCNETQYNTQDTGWFVDPHSNNEAKCTERQAAFNSYCDRNDAMSLWDFNP